MSRKTRSKAGDFQRRVTPVATPETPAEPPKRATEPPWVKAGPVWHGIQVYQCPFCHVEGFDRDEIVAHAKSVHVKERPSKVLGLDGNPAATVVTVDAPTDPPEDGDKEE